MKKDEGFFAIYSRKSKFTGKGESIGNQVELCKEYLRSHYGNIADEKIVLYEDEGFSGKNMDRPALQQLMKEVDRKRVKAVIVYRLDRISRNVGDFYGLIDKLSRLNIDFISIREQFDTGTPMGRAMMYIASVFSQLERETTAERIRDNMHELAKTGRWLGGITPTGYTSESVETVTVDGKKKKACKLKEIPEEAAIIQTIFSLYKKTDSQTMTETELIRRKIKTKNGKYFTRYSIKAILQNPVYVIADEDTYEYFISQNAALFSSKEEFDGIHGMMAYNRTDQNGKTTIYKPMEEWIVSVGRHPGLIRGKDWVEVQKSLERNKVKSYRKPRSNEAILTGMIYCSCGNRMYPKLTTRKNADGDFIYTYVCKMKERSRRALCNEKSVNGNTLDRAVIQQIKSLNEDDHMFLKGMNRIRKYYANHNDDKCKKQVEWLKKEKGNLEKKVESLVNSLVGLEEGFAKNQLLYQLEKAGCEMNDLKRRIHELTELNKKNEGNALEFDLFLYLLSSFANSMDDMSTEEKRTAIRKIVKNVIWDGKNIHVYLFGASPEDDSCIQELSLIPWGEDGE